jgi:hypothetical protein
MLEGRSQEHVMGDWAKGGGVQSEVGKIVPGGGGNPRVLALGGLSANEASGVSDAEGADGSDVEEKRIVDGLGD